MNRHDADSSIDHHTAASPSPHAVFGLDGAREILDACCGGRMWWWDKEHPLAVYMDVREAPKGSVGELTGRPEWNPNWSCEPTCKGDFRNMPFEDESFQLVVFDPPHVTREKQPPEGINGLKYGALHPDTEQEDLRLGFMECWRVLRPGGTLVFKWAGPTKRVEPHFPATPIVGTRSPRGGQTRWFIFYKPLDARYDCGPWPQIMEEPLKVKNDKWVETFPALECPNCGDGIDIRNWLREAAA